MISDNKLDACDEDRPSFHRAASDNSIMENPMQPVLDRKVSLPTLASTEGVATQNVPNNTNAIPDGLRFPPEILDVPTRVKYHRPTSHTTRPSFGNSSHKLQTESSFSLKRNIHNLPPFRVFLLVMIGGALGSITRYGFILSTANYQPSFSTSYSILSSSTSPESVLMTLAAVKSFPCGTFICNLTGCFLIGLFQSVLTLKHFHSRKQQAEYVRAVVITGYIGALTTMSTYAFETVELFQDSDLVSSNDNTPDNTSLVINHEIIIAHVTEIRVNQDDGDQWLAITYLITSTIGGLLLVFVALHIISKFRKCLLRVEASFEPPSTAKEQVRREERREQEEEVEMSASTKQIEHGETIETPGNREMEDQIQEQNPDQSMKEVKEGQTIEMEMDRGTIQHTTVI